MFKQYFYPDENKNGPTQYFGVFIDSRPCFFAYQDSGHRCQKRNRTDDDDSRNYFLEQQSHAKTNSQRINAGGKGHDYGSPELQRVFYGFGFVGQQVFNNHFTADQGEQAKSYPVVNRFDQASDTAFE